LADNRLVVDIYNAVCLLEGPFHFDDTVPVAGIRASQFMDYPKVTRLVFDLKDSAEFTVSLSEDRTTLLVSFEQNIINEVRFTSTGVSDSIIITGKSQPLVTVTPVTNPDRLRITVTNAVMQNIGEHNTNGVFTYKVNAWQEQDIGYIEAYVTEFPNFRIEYNNNSATVRMFRNNLANMTYDSDKREIHITRAAGFTMDIFSVVHKDDYAGNRYTLTFPMNAEEVLGYGDLQINDGFINAISVEQDTFGQTRLVIYNARVLTFNISETNEAYVIRAVSPREGSPPVVIIDPGHGGSAPGSTSGGMLEKNLNLSISLKLKQLLDQEPSIIAYFTRTDDRDVSNSDRAVFANANGDIFISVHCNAMRNNSTSHGIETYFWPHDNDTALGFSCERLAHIMQRNLLASTGAFNRGVKTDNLTVLRETTIPAVLVEVGFMSNPSEAAKLASDDYQWLVARGLFNGIMEAFSQYSPRR
jgi:N-acetylmuramoyl-L-alanine amidase